MKDMVSLPNDLIEIIKTKEDKLLFMQQLATVSQSLFTPNKKIAEILTDQMPYYKKEKILALARKYDVAIDIDGDVQLFIQYLTTAIQGLPEIILTIAVEPTEEIITSISQWLSLQLKTAIVIEIIIDPTLIAGCIIGYLSSKTKCTT